MNRRLILVLVLALLLTACGNKTLLRFSNETECGAASITLTNMKTGSIKDYTVNQGKQIDIEIDPEVEYHYEVDYPRQPDYVQCDSKKVTTMVNKGQRLNIRLASVLDPALEQTQTAAPAVTASPN